MVSSRPVAPRRRLSRSARVRPVLPRPIPFAALRVRPPRRVSARLGHSTIFLSEEGKDGKIQSRMMHLYIDAPQNAWEATCVEGATRHSIVASISVGSAAVGSRDDPATGTVDGKYSSPPPGDPGPRISMLTGRRSRAQSKSNLGDSLISNFDIRGRVTMVASWGGRIFSVYRRRCGFLG